MQRKLFIPALESMKKIREESGQLNDELPIAQLGTTYVMAQASCWVSIDKFLVGRWDGSLSIFEKTSSATQGAEITIASSAPSDQGIQMVTWVAENTFATSNDDSSIAIWQASDSTFENVMVKQIVAYESSFGIANSAQIFPYNGANYLVSGHESGFLLIFEGTLEGDGFSLVNKVDLTSSTPTNPWNLQNIRGVAFYDFNGVPYAITGSENGLISVVRIPDGSVMSQMVYNPDAQRGINAISIYGGGLIVGNCSVGPDDKNFWFYGVEPEANWSIKLYDSANLVVDNSRQQVFNFCVTWGWFETTPCWYAATEEGVLWMGTISSNREIQVTGYQNVAAADLGAALAATTTDLSYVAYNVCSFSTNPSGKYDAGSNPNFPNSTDVADLF